MVERSVGVWDVRAGASVRRAPPGGSCVCVGSSYVGSDRRARSARVVAVRAVRRSRTHRRRRPASHRRCGHQRGPQTRRRPCPRSDAALRCERGAGTSPRVFRVREERSERWVNRFSSTFSARCCANSLGPGSSHSPDCLPMHRCACPRRSPTRYEPKRSDAALQHRFARASHRRANVAWSLARSGGS